MSTLATPASENALAVPKLDIGLNENGLVLFGAAVLLGAVLWAAFGPRVEKTDFSVTYVGAWMMHHGEASKLYDLQEQAKVKSSLFKEPNPLLSSILPSKRCSSLLLARCPIEPHT